MYYTISSVQAHKGTSFSKNSPTSSLRCLEKIYERYHGTFSLDELYYHARTQNFTYLRTISRRGVAPVKNKIQNK